MAYTTKLGYLEPIYEGFNSTIYYLEESEFGEVIVKILKNEYPTLQQIVQFNNEYQLTKDLDISGIRKALKKERIDNKHALFLEYFDGVALKRAFAETEKHLRDCLKIAISVAETLGKIHHHNLIHKDINSNNILVNLDTYEIKIIDFGISSSVDVKQQESEALEILEGTLDYISPEQTGRTHKVVDYRSDLYSLGVTFYELFTGELPFHAEDSIELVHCHIAKHPKPPHEIDPNLPPILSNIILKLMAKNAEERYHSAFGLKADLEKCLNRLTERDRIPEFELGKDDFSGKLQISTKMYGRESELETIMEMYEEIGKGNKELIFIAGDEGVGKSSVLGKVQKEIVGKKGYFVLGNFDKFQEDVPYYGISSAFTEFVNHLLKESAEELSLWKEKIIKAVGKSGQVLLDIIPNLEMIIGKQPPIQELGTRENQNRFNFVFTNFIRTICQPYHPLVLCLDNLQWADSASLHLIKMLMTEVSIKYLLIIGAYRPSEVPDIHLLNKILSKLESEDVMPTELKLSELSRGNIRNLVAESLESDKSYSKNLADLIYEKTHGNVFFVRQFLASLVEENLLNFDFSERKWIWDIEKIKSRKIAENVADLMAEKIHKLPNESQKVLKLASCIGEKFDLKTVSAVYGETQSKTLEKLMIAVEEGMMLPIDENYKLIQLEEAESGVASRFEFLHNRIHQVAYSLIPKEEKQEISLKIGRFLMNEIPEAERTDRLFEIVTQMNAAIELLDSQEEKYELARLNLQASEKAKTSTAYASAYNYLAMGKTLLDENAWNEEYELTKSLYEESAEIAGFTGDYEMMNQMADVIEAHAKRLLDKIRIYEVKIEGYISQGRLSDAIAMTLPVLKSLGVKFPKHPQKYHLLLNLFKIKIALWGKSVEDLIDLPAMENPKKLAAMKLLSRVGSAAYFSYQELYGLTVLQRVYLSIKYGNVSYSILAYAPYGIVLCGKLGKLEEGYKFGQLALKLMDQLDAREFRARTLVIIHVFITHWKEHLEETLPPLKEAYSVGTETGDLEYAGWGAFNYLANAYFVGKELTELEKEFAEYGQSMEEINQRGAYVKLILNHQMLLNLMGMSENPLHLHGDAFDEEIMLPELEAMNDRNTLYLLYHYKATLGYLFGDFSLAFENIRIAEDYLDAVTASVCIALFKFYDSLIRLARFFDFPFKERKAIIQRILDNQKTLKEFAEHAPMNIDHKYYLVEAEIERVMGRDAEARELYDKAISLANKTREFIQEEALANELAARFYYSKELKKLGNLYLRNAHYLYKQWGAAAKVEALEEEFPQCKAFGAGETPQIFSATTTIGTRSTSSSTQILDINTVIKASQAIFGEIQIRKLLSKLVNITIENAGAQRGILILKEDGELLIQAEGDVASEATDVLQAIPLDESTRLSPAIVRYAAQKMESLVLHNATEDGDFTFDSYIIKNKPKSILCMPIIEQKNLVGILYLENNITTGAFTENRLEVLKLLASQIAISIKNALLVENLKEQERLKKEMEIAQRIQTSLLPVSPEHNELEIAATMRPAEEVGGDYYDMLFDNEGNLWFAIGDVSGHGVTPGLIMIMAQSSIYSSIKGDDHFSPKKVIRQINRTLTENIRTRLEESHFMTMNLLKYNGKGMFRHAGLHIDIVVYRNGKKRCERIETKGVFLGVLPDVSNILENLEFQLDVNDIMVLYTDGIIEAMNPNREQLEPAGLMKIIEENADKDVDELRDKIVSETLEWCEYRQADDITLIVVRRVR